MDHDPGSITNAGAKVVAQIHERAFLRMAVFGSRDISKRTIEALIDYGMDAPERVLFMTESQLSKIPGIGAVAMKELRAYRHRFLPDKPKRQRPSPEEREARNAEIEKAAKDMKQRITEIVLKEAFAEGIAKPVTK